MNPPQFRKQKIRWPMYASVTLVSVAIICGIVVLVSSHGKLTHTPKQDNQTTSRGSSKHEEPKDPLAGVLPSPKARPAKSALSVPILMYHHINDGVDLNDKFANLTVSSSLLDTHLTYLDNMGYKTITMTDYYNALYFDSVLPPKPIILTFDDGFLDNYQNAYPLLKKHRMKGVFFVITSCIGKKNFKRDNDYMEHDFVTSSEIREMSDAGMEMLPHTVTHPDLRGDSIDEQKREIVDSKITIEETTGKHVYFFAYPFGYHSQLTINILRENGFYLSLGTVEGIAKGDQNPFELKRMYVGAGYDISGFLP